jgi:hypothetical protein
MRADMGARRQLRAITESTDAPQAPTTPPSSDSPTPPPKEPAYDAPWGQRVLENVHGIADFEGLTAADLEDEETRNWVNRKIRKKREADAAAAAAAPAAAPAAKPAAQEEAKPAPMQGAPTTAPPAPVPQQQKLPTPTVLRSGRLPIEPIFQAPVAQPVNGGWVPAYDGLWWPPYPQTGGPIPLPKATQSMTKPASAQAQLAALED